MNALEKRRGKNEEKKLIFKASSFIGLEISIFSAASSVGAISTQNYLMLFLLLIECTACCLWALILL